MKSLKLAYGVPRTLTKGAVMDYKVVLVKNSTAYHPGQILVKAEVDDLCNNPRWDVTIMPIGTQGAAT